MNRMWCSLFRIGARKSLIGLTLCIGVCLGYYENIRTFGTGDSILSIQFMAGGFNDEYHKWTSECHDGEGMTGIFDSFRNFMAVNQMWCYFMFPKKPPSSGFYPYYPRCHIRNFTQFEYYCYDKFWPTDTVNSFSVGLYGAAGGGGFQNTPTLMKCCKTPSGYKIDYNRCQWKYTHDKNGEHYDGLWLVKCDTHHVMTDSVNNGAVLLTGMGQALNPWDNAIHFTWIQCCPVIYTDDRYDKSQQFTRR